MVHNAVEKLCKRFSELSYNPSKFLINEHQAGQTWNLWNS
jgi:hypothetical protein